MAARAQTRTTGRCSAVHRDYFASPVQARLPRSMGGINIFHACHCHNNHLIVGKFPGIRQHRATDGDKCAFRWQIRKRDVNQATRRTTWHFVPRVGF